MANSAWKSGGQVTYTGDSLGNVPCGSSYQATGLLPAMYSVPRMPVCMFQFVKGFSQIFCGEDHPCNLHTQYKKWMPRPGVFSCTWIMDKQKRTQSLDRDLPPETKSLLFGTGTAKWRCFLLTCVEIIILITVRDRVLRLFHNLLARQRWSKCSLRNPWMQHARFASFQVCEGVECHYWGSLVVLSAGHANLELFGALPRWELARISGRLGQRSQMGQYLVAHPT